MNNNADSLQPVENNFGFNDHSYHDLVLLRETSNSRLYRIKRTGKQFIIKTPINNSTLSVEILKREYDIAINLSHPNIVNIFTYDSHSPVGPGIIMEYINGNNLSDFLSNNPSLASKKKIFSQLLDAISYIHQSSIIHNDLKPSNILITKADNDLKLIDFGLADNDAHYMLKTLGCTPTYASPELLCHCSDIDCRSDIFSIGVIMKEIFGKKYSSISNKCTNPDPNKRYSDINQLRVAWNRAIRRPKHILTTISTIAIITAIIIPFLLYQSQLNSISSNETKYQNLINQIESEKINKRSIENDIDRLINSLFTPQYDILTKSHYKLSHTSLPDKFLLSTNDSITNIINNINDTELQKYASNYAEYQKYVAHEKLKIALLQAKDNMLQSMLDQYQKEAQKEFLLTKDSITSATDIESCALMPSNFLRRQSIILGNIKNMTDDQNLYSEFYLKAVNQYYTPYYEKINQLYSSKR